MRQSAVRIWARTARTTVAPPRMPPRATAFPRRCAAPGLLGWRTSGSGICPQVFSQFKIEGRGLGSALVLEFLLYYMTKPEYRLQVREEIYLDNMLDLF